MKQLKPILLGILAACFFSNSHAQYNKVLAASNFGGVSTVSYNPAIADNRMKFDLNLISVGLEVNNNYIGISNQPLLHRDFFKDDKFADKYLIERVNGNNKKAFIGMDAQIPLSFMFAWGKNRSNKNAIEG